jgi:hypothetical protein
MCARRHERQVLLQYLKEQLLGGFADALQGDIAALERANSRLRQEYDSRDLQVGLLLLLVTLLLLLLLASPTAVSLKTVSCHL